MIYDRYIGKYVKDSDLPKEFSFGRFAKQIENEWHDLTNIDVKKYGEYIVRQTLLDDNNRNIHDLLAYIASCMNKSFVKTKPIFQEFESNRMNEFELLLINNISHLTAISRNPHCLLDKETMKVNIGRAKRISNRSYQHLTHHPEDWASMSAISPKPRRILHEELSVNHSIYENQLYKSFLQQTIRYINSRIKETTDITRFYELAFNADFATNVWSERIERMLALIGRATKESSEKNKDLVSNIHKTLLTVKSQLNRLVKSPFLSEISNDGLDSMVLHDTNVLNSHKHYKYLKVLWSELLSVKRSLSIEESFNAYQDIINNFRLYTESLFVYTIQTLGYEVKGDIGNWHAKHSSQPNIEFNTDGFGVMHLSTNSKQFRIIALGGISSQDSEKMKDETYIFNYSDFQKQSDENIKNCVHINPMDSYSIESVGIIVRKLLLSELQNLIFSEYSFDHKLRDYINLIHRSSINFDVKKCTYRFIELQELPINSNLVIDGVKRDPMFNKKNHRDKSILLDCLSELIKTINNQAANIEQRLICPKCSRKYLKVNLGYFKCDCGFILDYTNGNIKFYHSEKDKQPKMRNISDNNWGMDLMR